MFGRRPTIEFGQEADGLDPFADPSGDIAVLDPVETNADAVDGWVDADPVAFDTTGNLGEAQLTLDEHASEPTAREVRLASPLGRGAVALLGKLGGWQRVIALVGAGAVAVALLSGVVPHHDGAGDSGHGGETKRRDIGPAPRPAAPRAPDRPYERPRPRRRRHPRPARPPASRHQSAVSATRVETDVPAASPAPEGSASQEFGFER